MSKRKSTRRSFKSRAKEKREKKVSAVRSIFSALNSMNKAITDIPGTLAYSKDTQEGLELAADELKATRDVYLPIANKVAPVVIGGFAVGSFFIVREIYKEYKNV